GYRILYIEDNKSNIRLLEQFFYRHSTLRLDVAEDAWLGIYKARQSRPDVIILDINLPGLDGFEVFTVLQQDLLTAHIPVIGLSANVMSMDIQRAQSAGFYEYLTKPLNIAKLVGVLNTLAAPAARDESAD